MTTPTPLPWRRPRKPLTAALCGLGLLAAFITLPALAADLDDLARALGRLRAEVEALSVEIRDVEEARRQRLRSLAAQKTDLEIELGRARTRLRQLQDRKAKLQAESQARTAHAQALRPAADAAITIVKDAVATTMPFKLTERLEAINQIKSQLDDKLITPQQALWRLWERVEDERRLARENGLHQDTINLDGQTLLVRTARLGMVMMYFSAADGRYGRLQRDGDRWRWIETTDEDGRAQIALLFDALQKQIRAGHFTLPQALTTAEAP